MRRRKFLQVFAIELVGTDPVTGEEIQQAPKREKMASPKGKVSRSRCKICPRKVDVKTPYRCSKCNQ